MTCLFFSYSIEVKLICSHGKKHASFFFIFLGEGAVIFFAQ